MKELIKTLKNYQADYIGKRFEDTDLDDSIEVILATDDGCDTDLHTCSIANENGAWIKFYVNVNPITNEIVEIDTTCVDYSLGRDYDYVDCVNVDDIIVEL